MGYWETLQCLLLGNKQCPCPHSPGSSRGSKASLIQLPPALESAPFISSETYKEIKDFPGQEVKCNKLKLMGYMGKGAGSQAYMLIGMILVIMLRKLNYESGMHSPGQLING